MTTVDIYRAGSVFVTVKPDSNSVQVKKVMGDNLVNLSFEDSRNIIFRINDYCTVFGEVYSISELPVVTKGSTREHKYALVLRAKGYDLAKCQFLFLGPTNALRETDFSLMGDANTFVDLVIANANRVAGSTVWVKGQVIPTVAKNLSFNAENCYNALSRIAEAFETEFAVEGTTIHVTKRLNDTGWQFRNARGQGLYEITRLRKNDTSLITRLYAYGSDKNLPSDYNGGAKRLQMRALTATAVVEPDLIHDVTATWTPSGGNVDISFSFTPATNPGTTLQLEYRLIGSSGAWTNNAGATTSPRVITVPAGSYEFRFRTLPTNAVTASIPVTGAITTALLPSTRKEPVYYLEENTAQYGVIEATQIFEDIFPHRTGTVTGVDATNEFKFTDAAIDFDVNTYLLPGVTAKVTFNTGQLAGYTFDIQSFNFGSKLFTILKNKDEKLLELPSASLRPAIGDTYVLTDIKLPQSYIDTAEAALRTAAQAALDLASTPQLTFTLTFDPKVLKQSGRICSINDLIWIIDEELEIERKIRVTSVTRNLIDEYSLQVEVSDVVTPGTISLLIQQQASTGRDVTDLTNVIRNNTILDGRMIGDLTIDQGTVKAPAMPTTTTLTGFLPVYFEQSSGKLYIKV